MANDRIRVPLPGFDAAMRPWGTARLYDFNLIYALEIRTAVWRRLPVQDLYVGLQGRGGPPTLRLHICFRGVRDVEIANTRQLFLDLYDVSARGWEDVFYEARDEEQFGTFKLLCRDIDLMSVVTDLGPPGAAG